MIMVYHLSQAACTSQQQAYKSIRVIISGTQRHNFQVIITDAMISTTIGHGLQSLRLSFLINLYNSHILFLHGTPWDRGIMRPFRFASAIRQWFFQMQRRGILFEHQEVRRAFLRQCGSYVCHRVPKWPRPQNFWRLVFETSPQRTFSEGGDRRA